jgi:class 3 adenylate cyclase
MHRALRGSLPTASGESRWIVAVNIDIRGFSSFFSDSSQPAAYLGSAYTRILDDYFSEHSFFKPTGDGLLIVRHHDRDTLQSVVREMVEAAVRLTRAFPSICKSDALINSPTPKWVGIGIARGTATRIAADDKVLDYSGRPLNLCSRLMHSRDQLGSFSTRVLGLIC